MPMYDGAVHELAERVLRHIQHEQLLGAGDRVGVAVSGGIDSVGLLRLLLELRSELGIILSVVHFNHKLRGAESDADQEFVAELAREHGLEFYCESGDVAQFAAEEQCGLEAAARQLRYGFFGTLLGSGEGGEAHLGQDVPQGLKPASLLQLSGTAEAMPLQDLPNRSAQSAAPPEGRPAEGRPPGGVFSHNRSPDGGVPSPILLNKIATGHTLDDQAETVLMRVMRGTGPRGLGGIYPRIVVEREDGEGYGEIVRPLLEIRRRELERYLVDLNQPWREDLTNTDSKFTRNRLRKLVLPLLESEFNPALAEGLAELAEIARDEEDYWENEVSGWLGTVVQWSQQPAWLGTLPGFGSQQSLVQIKPSGPEADPEVLARIEEAGVAPMNASVSRPWLLTEPVAVQRRVLKAVGEQAGIPLEFKHIEKILRFAAENGSGKELSLPLGWKVIREPEAITFVTPDLRRTERVPDYEYLLRVPGRVAVPEVRGVIEALRFVLEARGAEYNPQQLLRADLLAEGLIVRNWRPGDRFWPAHTKASKKVKELLQERHVAQPERRLWPVVASGDEIVWMRGFPVPARLHPKEGQQAVLIQEVPGAIGGDAI